MKWLVQCKSFCDSVSLNSVSLQESWQPMYMGQVTRYQLLSMHVVTVDILLYLHQRNKVSCINKPITLFHFSARLFRHEDLLLENIPLKNTCYSVSSVYKYKKKNYALNLFVCKICFSCSLLTQESTILMCSGMGFRSRVHLSKVMPHPPQMSQMHQFNLSDTSGPHLTTSSTNSH